MTSQAAPLQRRVLVHAPRGRDAFVITQVLRAQAMRADVCSSLEALTDALDSGAGTAFVTEESLVGAPLEALATWIARQPPWSDFPFIVLVARRVGNLPSEATGALAKLGNVVLLERPLNAETLASAARSALRARDRQYETRRHLLEQEEARLAERLANAEAIRANEALEVAVEAGELGTFHCPWPLDVIEWNAKCKEHFWLGPEAHIDFDLFYSILHEDDRERVRAAIDAAVQAGALYDVEYRTVSPRGAWRWIRAKGRIYRDAAGEPTRFDGVTIDISRQKLLEQEREALLAAERQARLDAERASRMKDEFLATLSHELRTPLSAILGWTSLLARAPGSIDVAKAVATIDRNARAQARLIEELLDVSRITSGRVQLDIQPVSIATVFEAAVSSLKPAADARSITLRQRELPEGCEILADASRLQQIVWNLLSNAIKFTPPGGSVTLAAERLPDEVRLVVSDDGAGIPAEFLPHAFERFRQAESSEARTHGGLGLGLAIVRQLVELHGGSVEATSAGIGRGATFTVRLPTRAAAIVAAETPTTTEAALAPTTVPAALDTDLSGRLILVVDDDDDGREMLAHMLRSWGAQVRATGSADEALAALSEDVPDLVISDIGMPRVDGYELMRRIRALPRPDRRELPAIALTAFARGEDAIKAQDAGYGVHLPKPVDPSRLYSTIVRVLGMA